MQYVNIAVMVNHFLDKIVINVGIGRHSQMAQFDEKILPTLEKEVAVLSGQKPAERKAKKAISNFKSREGNVIGLQVTLRGVRMSDFFNRLISIVLPRVKDFRGLEMKNIDQGGALNIGFKEQYVFPEINPETSHVNFGVQVTMVPKKRNREAAIDFYKKKGVPLKFN